MICPEINLRVGTVVSRNRVRQWAILGLAVLIGINLLLVGWLIRLHMHNSNLESSWQTQQAQPLKSKGFKGVKPVRKKQQAVQKDQVTLVNHLIQEDAFSWTRLLGRLEKTLVPGVRLVSIRPDVRKKHLMIVGQAKDPARLRQYLTSLLQSPWFKETYLSRQVKKDRDTTEGHFFPVDFQLEIRRAF